MSDLTRTPISQSCNSRGVLTQQIWWLCGANFMSNSDLPDVESENSFLRKVINSSRLRNVTIDFSWKQSSWLMLKKKVLIIGTDLGEFLLRKSQNGSNLTKWCIFRKKIVFFGQTISREATESSFYRKKFVYGLFWQELPKVCVYRKNNFFSQQQAG